MKENLGIKDEKKEVLNILHLNKLKEIQKAKQEIYNEFAEIGILKFQVKKRDDSANAFLEKTQLEEQNLLQEIREMYGEISVNLETGEISKVQKNDITQQ